MAYLAKERKCTKVVAPFIVSGTAAAGMRLKSLHAGNRQAVRLARFFERPLGCQVVSILHCASEGSVGSHRAERAAARRGSTQPMKRVFRIDRALSNQSVRKSRIRKASAGSTCQDVSAAHRDPSRRQGDR